MQMSEEVVYMAVLGGIYPAPVTVAIFKSLECAEEFCNLKNMSIPSDNICHLSVQQMTMGAPSEQELRSRVNPPINNVTQNRLNRIRDAKTDYIRRPNIPSVYNVHKKRK